MPKSQGLVDLVSLKQHKTNLNQLMKLETLAPGRRQLAQMVAMWLDAKTEHDKEFLELIMISLYTRRTKWREEDDPSDPTAPTKQERDADAKLQGAWDAILEGKRTNASE
jgi:hypothetical protein